MSFTALDSARPHATCLGALRTLTRLALPVRCAGCGVWDTRLCPQCRQMLCGPLQQVTQAQAAEDLAVYALSSYSGPVRTLILGWKNGSREDLNPFMAQAGFLAGCLWASQLAAAQRRKISSAPGLLIVPAPSGRGRRLRGRLVVAAFADWVARGIAATWSPATVPLADPQSRSDATAAKNAGANLDKHCPVTIYSADILRRRHRSGSAHQTNHSAQQRRLNRRKAPRVLAPISGWYALLVDDVVTTGSTLASCALALKHAHAMCLGALTLAATPGNGTKPHLPPHPPTASFIST